MPCQRVPFEGTGHQRGPFDCVSIVNSPKINNVDPPCQTVNEDRVGVLLICDDSFDIVSALNDEKILTDGMTWGFNALDAKIGDYVAIYRTSPHSDVYAYGRISELPMMRECDRVSAKYWTPQLANKEEMNGWIEIEGVFKEKVGKNKLELFGIKRFNGKFRYISHALREELKKVQ